MGANIINWITDVLGGELGRILGVMFISMLPVIELRGAIPAAFALGLDWKTAFICSIIGNTLPVPFILLFVEAVFKFMKKHNIFAGFVRRQEEKAVAKSGSVTRYEFLGLALFVAVPLPGTGGWTGALIASVMKMDKNRAFWSILLGIIVAGIVVTAATYGLVGSLLK